MAAQENAGICKTGRASSTTAPTALVSMRPNNSAATAPMIKAPIIGGMKRPNAFEALSANQAPTIGPAMAKSE